jgi:hypothetical protein
MNIKNYIVLIFVFGILPFQTQAATSLKWVKSAEEVIKPIKVEVDESNADVGSVFVYVTYEMVKPCKNLFIFSKSISSDGVVLNEFPVQHANVPAGSKYRDMFMASYQPGHSVLLDKVSCH